MGSNTMSLGQIFKKSLELNLGNTYGPTIMKLNQNVCLIEIIDFFNMGHVGSISKSLGQILEKSCPKTYLGIDWSD